MVTRNVDYIRAQSVAVNSTRLLGDEGTITEPLSTQWKFVLRLVESSLEGGLDAADACTRGVAALVELRRLAVEHRYDQRDQVGVKRLIVAACKSSGAETGETLARRACDAWRRVREWKVATFRDERAKQAKGKAI